MQRLSALSGLTKVAELVSSENATTHKSICLQRSCPGITYTVKPHCAHLAFHSQRHLWSGVS